jgi:hypothetical protein
MKQVEEVPPPAEVALEQGADLPDIPQPVRSSDQDDFDELLHAGMRTAAAVYRRRRKHGTSSHEAP